MSCSHMNHMLDQMYQ